jgi:hypothetical protein
VAQLYRARASWLNSPQPTATTGLLPRLPAHRGAGERPWRQYHGDGGWPDSSVCRWRGGLGTVARATRWGGGLVWGTSGRRGSSERALGGGGGSAEGLTGARLEEQWVASVVRLEGTRVSWWSLGMRRRRQTKTRGDQRQEGALAAAIPNDGQWLACTAVTCRWRREWAAATGAHSSGLVTHRHGRGRGKSGSVQCQRPF